MLNNTNDGTREKNYSRIMELEDICFRLQADLDNNHSLMCVNQYFYSFLHDCYNFE